MVRKNREKILYITGLFLICMMILLLPQNSYAANAGAQAINKSMNALYEVVAALVSSVGSIFVLWGFFEFGTSLQSPNGSEQGQAFKRIAGGLLMVIGPAIVIGLLG